MKHSKLSYLRPLFLFFMSGIVILLISRLVIFSLYKERLVQVEDYMRIFSLGMRLDIILMSYLSFIPALILTAFPSSKRKLTTKILAIYCSIFLFLVFFHAFSLPGNTILFILP